MLCPNCSTDVPASLPRCPSCETPVPDAARTGVAVEATADGTAVYTPPPGTASASPLAAGAPFGPRYRILRQLGAGGMGVVYQAWDAELGVAVALKVIRPEVTTDPVVAREIERRFKRELLLARQVTHKHVVRIHDLGEIDGIKYLTMPYVEGQNLAQVLHERGRCEAAETVRLAKQVGAGLLAAHEAGVVHRDLKPENVMLDQDGQALIMDFGISRSVSPNATATATAAGAVIGTLEYMAPEQARGMAVDHRADIYAFGLLLHDMLAGRRRLTGAESALSEMMSRMTQPPAPLRTIAADVPEDLERIVSKCLQPDPEQRYASTAALVADLDALGPDGRRVQPRSATARWKIATAALVVLLLLVAGAAVWKARTGGGGAAGAPAAAVEPVSVLIADFDNQAHDPIFEGSLEQALGIAMEGAPFITSYSRRDALRAVAQIAPGSQLDKDTARLVSRREGIKVVLAGAIAPSGNGYRITVQALDALPGTELGSSTREAASKAQVLETVGRVAADLRAALGDTTTESGTLAADETFTASSLEAAKAYATAQRLAIESRDVEAIEAYKQAIALDPQFGRAYAGWAASAWKLGRRDEAEQQYQKAFTLINRMTEREKYRTFGAYYTSVAANYEKGIDNFSALVAKYPADSAAHNNLAVAYFHLLDFQKALAQGRRLTEIYPSSVLYRYNYALYAMYAGDFDTATAQAREAIELNPNTPSAYLALAMAALARGDAAAAREVYQRALATDARGASLATMGLGDLALFEGRAADAIALLEPGAASDETNRFTAAAAAKRIALGEAYLSQGNARRAIEQVHAAMALTRTPSVLVPGAGVLMRAGRVDEAERIATELAGTLQSHGATFARLVQARIALQQQDATRAVALLNPSEVEDLWLVRLARAIAYVNTGQPDAARLAWDDLNACEKRIGEATAVFLDDVPSIRYEVPLWYWRARVQDAGVGTHADALKDYQRFLLHRPTDSPDPLVQDARRRVSGS